VANCAIEDCKRDGEVLEERLDVAEAIDMEQELDHLAKRALKGKRAVNLFYGHTWYFYDFSPAQRTWIWYLISLITNELLAEIGANGHVLGT